MPEALTTRFYQEAKELVRGFDIPRPLDFYFDVFIAGLRFITAGSQKDKQYY